VGDRHAPKLGSWVQGWVKRLEVAGRAQKGRGRGFNKGAVKGARVSSGADRHGRGSRQDVHNVRPCSVSASNRRTVLPVNASTHGVQPEELHRKKGRQEPSRYNQNLTKT
jgi:hypothetical protein